MVLLSGCPLCGAHERSLVCRLSAKDFFYGYIYTITHLGPDPPTYYRIWRCENCGHWYVNPRLSETDLIACYPSDRFTHGVGYHPFNTLRAGKTQIPQPRHSDEAWEKHWRDQVQRIASFNAPRKSILDIGCANGAFLRQVHQGWRRVGIDNNRGAIELAQGLPGRGIEYICADLTSHNWRKERFGIITIFDTLEHMTDPKAVVEKVSELLTPGGICWIQTISCHSPGARYFGKNWGLLTPAVHLHYFDIGSLSRILKSQDLIVESTAIGSASVIDALRTDLRYRKRRVFLKLLLHYGYLSKLLCFILARSGLIDDRPVFLTKLKNINAAESLRPRLDDRLEIIVRKRKNIA